MPLNNRKSSKLRKEKFGSLKKPHDPLAMKLPGISTAKKASYQMNSAKPNVFDDSSIS